MEKPPASLRRARPLLGTIVEIGIGAPSRGAGFAGADLNAAAAAVWSAEAAVDAAFATVATVHRLMSFHEDDSDVARLNRQAAYRPVEVHPWTHEVLALALALYRDSAGLFDIAVAPVLRELGLLPGAPDRRAAHSDQTGAPFRMLADNRVCFTHHGIAIDLGGIAKGFAVDRAIETLRASGATQGMVNAGGDLAAFGPAPHPVYIRDPRHPGRVLAETVLFNGALATSGGRLDPMLSAAIGTCAVIDPAARAPSRAILGATVRAPTACSPTR